MYRTIPLIAALLLFLAACNSEQHRIERAANCYIVATSEYNLDEACRYCISETAKGLMTIKEHILPKLDTSYIRQNSKAEICIKDIVLINDTTANVFYHKQTPETAYSDTLTMVKRNGQWLAQVQFIIPEVFL